MPWVTCRCGEKLKVPPDNPEHLDCSRCGARIRVRRRKPRGDDATGDGFLRFLCPCGRRLKVSTVSRPNAGKCPDCGRVVPVPTAKLGELKLTISSTEADARTEDLAAADLAELEKWSARHLASSGQAEGNPGRAVPMSSVLVTTDDERLGLLPSAIPQPSLVKFETGLRVCPRCKKPLHLRADNCRACGMPVPRE